MLFTIDATCPLVTKVHVEARRFAAEGYNALMPSLYHRDAPGASPDDAAAAARAAARIRSSIRFMTAVPPGSGRAQPARATWWT